MKSSASRVTTNSSLHAGNMDSRGAISCGLGVLARCVADNLASMDSNNSMILDSLFIVIVYRFFGRLMQVLNAMILSIKFVTAEILTRSTYEVN